MYNNTTKVLAEIEKLTLSQKNASFSFSIFLTANPYTDTNRLGMTKNKIKDLIKIIMTFSQSQQNTDLQSSNKSL